MKLFNYYQNKKNKVSNKQKKEFYIGISITFITLFILYIIL
jgi:hypothetical protein